MVTLRVEPGKRGCLKGLISRGLRKQGNVPDLIRLARPWDNHAVPAPLSRQNAPQARSYNV